MYSGNAWLPVGFFRMQRYAFSYKNRHRPSPVDKSLFAIWFIMTKFCNVITLAAVLLAGLA